MIIRDAYRMLAMFMKKHKQRVHQLLNLMWENVEFIRRQLAERGYSVGPLVYGVENYVSINGRLESAHYHTPEFGFHYGVIGCTIDGLFFVMAIEVKEVSEAFLREVIKSFPQIQIYGGKHFGRDFYPPPCEEKEILQHIKNSREETIQLNITITNPWNNFKKASAQLLDKVEKLIRIAHSHRIKAVNPLRSLKYKKPLQS